MTRSKQHRNSGFARLAEMASILILIVAAVAVQAQTFQVLHNFTGGADGSNPLGRLSVDGGGHL